MSKTFKILAIDGGGFRGAYSAHLLKRMEDEFSVDWRKDFDLLASKYPDKELPHVYSQKEQRLCLYYPRGRCAWNSSMGIAKTIMPWTSEWLFFYELWLATGEWLGGGIHIETGKKDPK